MSAARMQLRGNCQCCGRDQAVVEDGRMAKHGYEVVGRGHSGYFKGVCQGNRYKPLQQDRDIANEIIKSCRQDALRLDQRAADYRAGEIVPEFCRGPWDPKAREYTKIPFADAEHYQRRQSIDSAIYECESRARAARSHADGLERLADALHGTQLREVTIGSGPEPIAHGEKRKNSEGRVLIAQSIDRGMVRWKDERGYGSKMSTRSWRLLERAA
jgi:hypothetical protein